MNARQRYIESLTFGRPDKIPFEPGSGRESTRARWHREGLPPGRDPLEYLAETLEIEVPQSEQTVDPKISFRMIPEFEEQVLEKREGHLIVQDWSGGIVEISDQYDLTYLRSAKDFVTRRWHKFPVETWQDWEQMQKRYDPASPERFPPDFAERCRQLKLRDYPVAINISGPFWQLREWCGLENLCIMMIEQPEFVDSMAAFWTRFVSDVLDRFLDDFCPDRVMIQEDMAYKSHSMISPSMAYRFLMPSYEAWVPRLKQAGCPVLDLDSDGYIGDLIPLWIEAGFNCCSPVEAAAGNDIAAFRRQYGTDMAFRGAIDKRAIAKGEGALEAELQRVIPPLLAEGGFIPGCDHGVPSDVSWPAFVFYGRRLAEMTGWLQPSR